MLDDKNRRLIMDRLGGAVDDLVADLYSEKADGVSVVQEADDDRPVAVTDKYHAC